MSRHAVMLSLGQFRLLRFNGQSGDDYCPAVAVAVALDEDIVFLE
jgi:hypothetical protein